MGLYPYNQKMGQLIQTNVDKIVADMAFLAHFQISAADAVALSNTAVHAAITLTTAKDVTTEITNPAVPRNIIVKGNAAGIAGDVVITGTDYAGEVITETIALNEASAVNGAKAFKTVTKIHVPAKTNGSGDTVSVGFGDALGLPFKLAHNTVFKSFLNNALEGTAATVTVSTTDICNNTIKLNSALNGSVVDAYLMV
jgi:hypothetical protein